MKRHTKMMAMHLMKLSLPLCLTRGQGCLALMMSIAILDSRIQAGVVEENSFIRGLGQSRLPGDIQMLIRCRLLLTRTRNSLSNNSNNSYHSNRIISCS
jgi:hypothetical protein